VLLSAMFRIGAFALIFDENGAVLLCHRRDMDVWNLPGGGVEQGESPWAAVVRETREEVGVEVEVERLVGVYSKREQSEVVFSFVCRVVGGALSCSDEADEIAFFPIAALPRNMSPKQAERVRDAALSPAHPVLRDQAGPGTRELVERGSWPTR
jgi:8-oxo-dGTP diphosphatase